METSREIYCWFAEVHIEGGVKISWRRVTMIVTVALIAARCFVLWIEVCRSENITDKIRQQQHARNTNPHLWNRKLAIVVPVHQGDKHRAVESLQKWPSKCHTLTMQNVDLVLYQAESATNEADLLALVADGPAKCFREVSVVSGNLLPEVYLEIFRLKFVSMLMHVPMYI